MVLPLFCYGTLTIPAVMRAVAGAVPRAVSAELPGFRCVFLAGRPYPGVFPAHACTRGMLYANPGSRAMARLDRYEGHEYRRRRVKVRQGNRQLDAWVYVPDPRYCRPGDRAWDPQLFAATGRNRGRAGRSR